MALPLNRRLRKQIAVFGPVSLVAIVVGWVILAGRNWRCPACDKYLGREFNPKRCRSCGMELRR